MKQKIFSVAEYLLKDEAIGGKLILAALAVALVAANTPFAPWYEALFQSKFVIGFGDWQLSMDLRHWISEGLMTFFFLVAGLELKRELVAGELRHKAAAVLPFAAAVGGMIVPALIFVGFNVGRETIGGWAIPTATDIALAVGVLALLGSRIPSSIRIFLLALAIVDDILAIIVIAVFYNSDLHVAALIAMIAVAGSIYWLGKYRSLPLWLFGIGGVALWLLTLESGIHPSIAGAALGLIAPLASRGRPDMQIAERIEKAMVPLAALVVVPLFAFANTGIALGSVDLRGDTAALLGASIITGLVLGKFIGIFGASWVMVKLGFASLPTGASWRHIAGVGFLAGIGFTVAIFVTDLTFTNPQYVMVAKISIIVASVVAALIGLAILWGAKVAKRRVA